VKSTPAVVLGIYSDSATSAKVLRDLRQSGWRRAVLLHHARDERPTVAGEVNPFVAILGLVALALLAGSAAYLLARSTGDPTSASWVVVPLLVASGGLTVLAVARWLGSRVDSAIIARFQRWLLPGESLVLVETSLDDASAVVELLRAVDTSEPATFVIRRAHRFPASPDDSFDRERFSAERLKAKAAELAARQRIARHPRRRHPLRHRVGNAERIIETITNDLTSVGRLDQGTSLATEWLLDNSYVIKRHAADVRRNLSRGFYNVLPVLESDTHNGEPRVYEIALELVASTNADVHEQDIVDFILAYQEVAPLTVGELWVLPLLLRLSLIEHLSRLAIAVDRRQHDHELADLWANRILSAARRAPDHLLLSAAELAREQPNPSPYVVDRIVSQLQGEAAALDTIRAWLERKLDAPLTEVIQQEQRRQAADQVAIANSIGSLRELARLDWRDVFERLSPVDRVLELDPPGVYAKMDFSTRDLYRAAIEHVARAAEATETAVASEAIALARAAGADDRRSHVGYYLVDDGRAALEAGVGCRWSVGQQLKRTTLGHPTSFYLIGISALTVALVALVLAGPLGAPAAPAAAVLALLALLALLPASELAVTVVNDAAGRALPPRRLPKLAFEEGIPDEWRTLVVVPTLLLGEQSIREDLESLEIRFLGNQEANLHYALLADFVDAPKAELPEDASQLAAARQGIEALNARYPGDRFSLFYRERVWSESEQVWMGWERKRGKLEELNRWLLADSTGANGERQRDKLELTLHHLGDRAQLVGTRFVITLDADTQLPRGAAHRLIGTLAHPLNRPRLAADGQVVSSGYTIIQPRMTTSLPSATATRFSRLLAGPAGTDPYTMAISDVYQDLFGEGSYHGKGIYDLATFHQVLDGRFPEATLLSHDLLEGAHVRVGLATDVELFDQFPSTYRVFAGRQHRWIRGDWQIADWCTPRVPAPNGRRVANPLSAVNRWKIADNLRRSLVSVGCVGLLVLGWLLQPTFALRWSALVAALLLLPPVLRTGDWLIARFNRENHVSMPGEGWRELANSWGTAIFGAMTLPFQALLTVDALGRVAYRRLVSHRQLLEWQTSRVAHLTANERERQFLIQIAAATSATALVVALLLVRLAPLALPAAAPFLALWLLAPMLVSWLDRDDQRAAAATLPATDRRYLRRLARQTWRYFDDLVGPQTNWLPPDNYQVALRVEVAPRTSPTNVGLWLLSTIAASDFGYLTIDQACERALATFETLGKLERFRGHILNWYNVQTLLPLFPRYVSTVDSGNLLACLWTFVRSYQELAEQPVVGTAAIRGLEDTLDLVQAAMLRESSADGRADSVSALSDLTTKLDRLFDAATDDTADVVYCLRQAARPARTLTELVATHGKATQAHWSGPPAEEGPGHSDSEVDYWAGQLDRQITGWLEVVDRYLPAPADETATKASPVTVSTNGARLRAEPNHSAPSLRALAAGGHPAAIETLARIERLVTLAEDLASDLDLSFLYDPRRRLFSIGYNVDSWRLDPSYFDLLASEARLASLVAIARGDVPADHWLTLGRPYGVVDGQPVLLSWTGTMFEYLMPLLLTRSYEQSLLDAACRQAVRCQIAYGQQHGVPWGISEAAFGAVDVHQIYQYQAFGVPGLGLKRGLGDDLVVAPYATALALLVDWHAAVRNLKQLTRAGAAGAYGYFDAIDYTPGRQAEGRREIVIATYMAHHQGMALLSLANALHDNAMQTRFHANPLVRAAEPLLFERIPAALPIVEGDVGDETPVRPAPDGQLPAISRFDSADTPLPWVHLLGNGSYAVMVTNAGGGYSRWRDFDVSRWRADATLDNSGSVIYLQDAEQGTAWSAFHQPIGRTPPRYAVTFESDRATFERRDVGIDTRCEIVVSPEDDAEIRRLLLVNRSTRARRLRVTSYVELALAPHNADRGHPAFSKLFVQTEALVERRALLAWRKPRGLHDPSIWAGHLLILPPLAGDVQCEYETDRARFVGRGRSLANPAALDSPLANLVGSPLDPIFSLRVELSLEPGERVELAYVTVAAETRERVVELVEKYQDLRETDRAHELAWYQAQLEPRHLRVTAEEIQRYQQLASYMLYPNARLRAAERQLRQNRLGQSRLWAYGISGDLPILVVTVGDRSDADLVREALIAHTLWRMRGFKSDLVILNEEASGYEQSLHGYLRALAQAHAQYTGLEQPGGIFLRPADQVPLEDLTLLQSVARVVLVASRGPLVQQLSAPLDAIELPNRLAVSSRIADEPSAPLPFLVLPYFNGVGGFSEDGREYAIYLGPGVETPAPWVNVMANPSFGALISESGQGFAWFGNSQSNRLLPWSNDPVTDPVGDAIYLRDEESGVTWTPTPRPIRERDAYRARHGQGYTVFEHNSHGIEQELVTFVPVDEAGGSPVRIQRLRLRNGSARRRRLSATFYAEWVLGENREDAQLHVVTSWDGESQALLARNAYHPDYAARVAFASCSRPVTSYSGDRTAFLGRNGSRSGPVALTRQGLARRLGAGLDPCAALQTAFELGAGQEIEVTFVLGQGADVVEARRLVRLFRDPDEVERALAGTRGWWDDRLGTIQVETPDLAVSFLLNRWLLYQTLSCRIWGRSAFYQSGGAFGFRDQLQDVMALLYAAPHLARQQILTAAARQFREGDVQHWWHPQSGAGVRTRISDDLLWLPYATATYVRVTGDQTILDEIVPFLEGHSLEASEAESFFVPTPSLEVGSILEHCRRAIAKGLTTGPRGLPLIGTGDWNDGLNLVGAGGRGESVWLAWFLIEVLNDYAELLERVGQAAEAEDYRTRAKELSAVIEVQAWDGAWYRRGYYDDGTPLGSSENDEARIDSLPQSWGAITGAAIPGHLDQALRAVEEQLVREQDRLILLFTPPFERGAQNPGYVKGYPPGVRENGGQYTHAAIWLALAFARRGEGDRAGRLLRILNPVEHARTPEDVERYQVEPYVVAADVYCLEGHVGRGGWTWYTGSSGWLYRVWLEDVLGFQLRSDRLTIDPTIPAAWESFKVHYRHRQTTYEIQVLNPQHVCHGVAWVDVDGQRQPAPVFMIQEDGGYHRVVVQLG
jgi:cyclic beta-1,2-glucan synthetase